MQRANRVKRALTVYTVGLAFCAAGLVGAAGAAQPASSDPLRVIPADSMFCLRIKDVNAALGQMDQFLMGVSPVSVSMLAQSRLAQLLGGTEANGVNLSGGFAVFGPLPGGDAPSLSRIGALIPVSDYQQFVQGNANVTPPDAQGVSSIGAEGKKDFAAINVGDYAMVTAFKNRPILAEMQNWISGAGSTSLAERLSPDELKRASEAPVWAFLNVQIAARMFGPTLQEKLKSVGEQINQMQAQGQSMMGQPEALFDMYSTLLDTLMQETQSISLSLTPNPNALGIDFVMGALPDTEMAKVLSADNSAGQLGYLGYLDNGAVMNFAVAPNPAFMKAVMPTYLNLLTMMMGGTASEEEMAQIKDLATDAMDVFEGTVAWSVSPVPKGKPPFAVKYVARLKDKQKFYEVLERGSKMINKGAIADLYTKFGLKTQLDLRRKAEAHQGVSIDALRFTMQPVDANSMQGQMITAMYGEGFDLRLAVVDDLLLYGLSNEPTQMINNLIDQVKAGGPGQVPSEAQAAMQLLGDVKQADFFGTFNILRFVQMVVAFLPMPLPELDLPTQSNVAIAGDIGAGKLQVRIAVPKQHLLEAMMAFIKMQQQGTQSQQQQDDGQI
jgi:hypothetical protein